MTAERSERGCFGFAVRSELPFHYLRAGGEQAMDLSVQPGFTDDGRGETLLEWKPSERFPLAGRLVGADGRFRLWIDTCGWFVIDADAPSVTMPPAVNVVRREERLWGVPAMLCLRARGDTALHAAAVEVAGEAIVLAAPGTFGKTTLAAAFHAAGHRLLSEDTTCVRTAAPAQVVPGPAMLRVRHDVAGPLRIPDATPVGNVRDDRVHLAIDPTRRGDCTPVPLRSIVLLAGPGDDPALERADPVQALRDLWSLSFRLPTAADRTRCFGSLAELGRSVPIWRLRRPLTLRGLPATVDHLAEHA